MCHDIPFVEQVAQALASFYPYYVSNSTEAKTRNATLELSVQMREGFIVFNRPCAKLTSCCTTCHAAPGVPWVLRPNHDAIACQYWRQDNLPSSCLLWLELLGIGLGKANHDSIDNRTCPPLRLELPAFGCKRYNRLAAVDLAEAVCGEKSRQDVMLGQEGE